MCVQLSQPHNASSGLITLRHNTLLIILIILIIILYTHNNTLLPNLIIITNSAYPSLPCVPPRSLPLAHYWLHPGTSAGFWLGGQCPLAA